MSHQLLQESQIHSKKWGSEDTVVHRPAVDRQLNRRLTKWRPRHPTKHYQGGTQKIGGAPSIFCFPRFNCICFFCTPFFSLSSSPSSPTKKNYQRVNSENWKCTGQFFCVSLHWPTDFWNHLQSFHSINPECSVMFGSGGYLVFCPFSADLKTAKHCTRYDGMDDIGRGAGILLGMYETNMT